MGAVKRILLIYTGGTIGMVMDEKDKSYHPFNFELIESQFPELGKLSCEIGVYAFDPPYDSSNIGPAVWVKIAKIIGDNYENYDGFVLLHGSDTMAYTGSMLSFLLEGLYKPVILTGAQLPIGQIRTDAKENLNTAIEIAAHPDCPVKEVAIYFEYKLYRANRTKKMQADSFSAFRSPNFRPIGEAGVKLKFFRETPEDAYQGIPFRVHDKLDTSIALKKFFPGIMRPVMDAVLLKEDIKGIIIESYGSGNLPTDKDLIASIKKSVEMGKIVVNITQCAGGTVDMGRYETSKYLRDVGVLGGFDLTCEAAVTKLMYLLGKYPDPEQVKHYMTRNIRGEMTSERAYTR